MPPLTPEQLAMRRTGITATDIAAIVGLNPYRSQLEVYASKVGEPDPIPDNEPMWWGRALEPVVAARYGELNDREMDPWTVTVRCADDPLLLATPDYVAVASNGDSQPVEVKTALSGRQVKRWGGGGDEVPEEYIVQCQWSMKVCGVDEWDIAALLAMYNGGATFRQYRLKRDNDLIAALVQRAHGWWEGFVEAGVEPPADGTDSAKRALGSLHPRNTAADIPIAMESEEELMAEYGAAAADCADTTAERDRLKQLLMQRIGDHDGIESMGGGRATWKANKNGVRTFRFTEGRV